MASRLPSRAVVYSNLTAWRVMQYLCMRVRLGNPDVFSEFDSGTEAKVKFRLKGYRAPRVLEIAVGISFLRAGIN